MVEFLLLYVLNRREGFDDLARTFEEIKDHISPDCFELTVLADGDIDIQHLMAFLERLLQN
ncbi:hypothetical protein D3C75_1085100 [compost metagenome]